MMVSKLSERQRRIAEDHHGILISFLEDRELSLDEYYDVVVFSFLKAVKKYDECRDLRKYEFCRIANRFMHNALRDYQRKLHNHNSTFTILSLDYSYPKSNLTFGDLIADERIDICEEVCERLCPTPKRHGRLHTHSNETIAGLLFPEEVM